MYKGYLKEFHGGTTQDKIKGEEANIRVKYECKSVADEREPEIEERENSRKTRS